MCCSKYYFSDMFTVSIIILHSDLLAPITLQSVGFWFMESRHMSYLSDSIYLIEFMFNNCSNVMQLIYSDRCDVCFNNKKKTTTEFV